MKSRKLLPFAKLRKVLNQKGQSIVEFVLLLVVVAGISYGFVSFMNRNLGRYWEYYANLVIDDKPGTRTVQLNQ